MQGEPNGVRFGTDSGFGRYGLPADSRCTGTTTAFAFSAMAQRFNDATLNHHEPRSYAAVAAAARSCGSTLFDLQVPAKPSSLPVVTDGQPGQRAFWQPSALDASSVACAVGPRQCCDLCSVACSLLAVIQNATLDSRIQDLHGLAGCGWKGKKSQELPARHQQPGVIPASLRMQSALMC